MNPEPVQIIAGPGTVWLPTDPPRPAPPLLTREETQALLRIPNPGSEGARLTIDRARRQEGLRGTTIMGKVKFRLSDVLEYMERRREH